VPQFGAQIWIEPGQTPEQIDGWFSTLEAGHMPVARLFMMWSYLDPTPNGWDWSLYDAAFRSAERHHVAIVATLTPSGPPAWLAGNDSQGIGVNATEEQRSRAADYIVKVVHHYKGSPALDTWLLLNEPGQAPVAGELADAGFAPWLRGRYADIPALNRMWGTDFASFAACSVRSSDHRQSSRIWPATATAADYPPSESATLAARETVVEIWRQARGLGVKFQQVVHSI